jgi:hypothetical protein
MLSRRAYSFLGSITVLAVTLVVTPAHATAVVRTPLPSSHFYAIVVDDALGVEFISGGPSSSDVAVFDTQASLLGEIPISGASGMTLVGTDLYVAAADANEIAVVDTTASPLAVSRTIDVSPLTNPTDLTYLAGNLWFNADNAQNQALLCSVGLGGASLTSGPHEGADADGYRFGSDITRGSTLYAIADGELNTFDVSTAPATKNGPSSTVEVDDSTVLPGGASLVETAMEGYTYLELRTSDLSVLGSYGGRRPYPTAVAATSSLGGLLAGGSDGFNAPDVWTFHIGDHKPFWSYDFRIQNVSVASHGLAWSSDGASLFAVTTEPYGANPALSVFHPPSTATKTPTLTGTASPSRFVTGEPTSITMHLGGGSTNRIIDVYERPVYQYPVFLMEQQVDANGDLTFAANPSINTTYQAYYDGDQRWLPAFTAVHVHVSSIINFSLDGSYAKDGRYFLYGQGEEPEATITVVPNHAADQVRVQLFARGRDGWKRVDATIVQLDGNSSGAVTVKRAQPGADYRMRTTFDGSGLNTGTISAFRYFRIDAGHRSHSTSGQPIVSAT